MSGQVGLKLTISLAVVVALGPAAIDMYLASMPQMAVDLHVSYASTQLSLTVFLIFMGLGQLLFGPFSDAFGRRRPLLIGLLTYALASAAAAYATSLEMLIWARIVQGLGAAMAIVVVMSIVRDISEGTEAAQLYALLNTIVALGPIIAPAIGGVLGAMYGWQGIMLFLATLGLVVLLNSLLNIPETLSVSQRTRFDLKSVLSTYAKILSNKVVLLNLMALSAVFFFLFVYIGGSAYVYQQQYGLSSEQFGLVFGLTSLSLILGASSSAYLVKKITVSHLALIGAVLMCIGGLSCVLTELFQLGLIGIVISIAFALFGLGILEATLMAIAMETQTTALGSTAALMGAIPMVLASTATPFAGALVEFDSVYWLALMGLIAPVILILVHFGSRTKPRWNVSSIDTAL
ncbi:DHA1 family bicyclomycin/chloramphenicol resistance-like MFS transporter [Acinetobacter calcoaceticus]|uniref:Bcr/CflA family efflux transporter n=1 Tax=Acinetobacter calcoaceticus TaxID=471 RepID=A0A4R1XXL2_ACICA|nr:DHA1 family bicyclomycin/chloramphenicol resistance-like MFS transporter [Acinetobacter calcoaceticus]